MKTIIVAAVLAATTTSAEALTAEEADIVFHNYSLVLSIRYSCQLDFTESEKEIAIKEIAWAKEYYGHKEYERKYAEEVHDFVDVLHSNGGKRSYCKTAPSWIEKEAGRRLWK